MGNIIFNLEEISEENNAYGILAKYLLDYDKEYQTLKIKKLSRDSNVSEAVPTRLAQRLNLEGFKELKYELVAFQEKQKLSTDKRLSYNGEQYLNGMNTFLIEIFTSLDDDKFNKLIKKIYETDNIVLFSQGGTATVLTQFAKTLTRLNKKVRTASNSEELFIISRTLREDELVITFSTTGNTAEVMEAYNVSLGRSSCSYLITSNNRLKDNPNTLILKDLNYDSSILTSYSLIGMISVLDLIVLEVINMDKAKYLECLNNTRIKK